jgi:oxygen-independent coproporphyrinogen III oxidase
MPPISSLYLHVPFCKHLCNYCDFYKKQYDPASNQLDDFHQFLDLSWQRHEKLMAENNLQWTNLESVYMGGGTPSLWGLKGAAYFKNFLNSYLRLSSDCEFTMEIDPGTWTIEMMTAWRENGLNRISIGTQSLDPKFLTIMDRSHSLSESHELLSYCSKEKINFSLDFLLGIPFSQEKKRDIKNELDQLLEYDPPHISLYILNARSKYPLINVIPNDEYIRDEYLFVSEYLQSQRFNHYEVSNFALPGFESRHNLRYWRGESVAALGPTGTGYFNLSPDLALRYKWKVSRTDFELEKLGPTELLLEKAYLSLRTYDGWKPDFITDHHHDIFSRWAKSGLGDYEMGKMKLNSRGFILLDTLMDDLFRAKII